MTRLDAQERGYEAARKWADSCLDTATTTFERGGAMGVMDKSHEQRQTEALLWVAAEIRAFRELMAGSAT